VPLTWPSAASLPRDTAGCGLWPNSGQRRRAGNLGRRPARAGQQSRD